MSIDNALIAWRYRLAAAMLLGGVPSLALRAGAILAVGRAIALGAEPQIQRRAERPEWEIRFADDLTSSEYARQIDYFKIEIAAVPRRSGAIEYIREVTQPQAARSTSGNCDDDNRLRIKWLEEGTLARRRPQAAGQGRHQQPGQGAVALSSRRDVRATLERLEREYAGRAAG